MATTRRSTGLRAMASAVGAAGVALAGVVVIGTAPTLSVSPELVAALHYLRGTNIGNEPTDQQFRDFVGVVIDGTGVPAPDEPYQQVPYNAGFRPFSHGGFSDLSYNQSVAQGVELLGQQQPAPGDIVFGFSQGAVAASLYKASHTGNTYVLVANPSRANGGVMQRFQGLTIPLVDVTFSGATPDNGDRTIDIARQYDGWADFPAYLWNPVAVLNAVMGIALVHGRTQFELTADDLEAARAAGPDYYQFDADSNTEYYVIRTYPVPLLMPLTSILPAPVIAALDAPLRAFIETAYDRSDYSKPTSGALVPTPRLEPPAPAAVSADVEDEPAADRRSLKHEVEKVEPGHHDARDVQPAAEPEPEPEPASEPEPEPEPAARATVSVPDTPSADAQTRSLAEGAEPSDAENGG